MTDPRRAPRAGIVVIGRNEGERLLACLDALGDVGPVVYVDSGSSDDSVSATRVRGSMSLRSTRPGLSPLPVRATRTWSG